MHVYRSGVIAVMLMLFGVLLPHAVLTAQTHDVVLDTAGVLSMIRFPQAYMAAGDSTIRTVTLDIDTAGRVTALSGLSADDAGSQAIAMIKGQIVATPARNNGCPVPSTLKLSLRFGYVAAGAERARGVELVACAVPPNPWLSAARGPCSQATQFASPSQPEEFVAVEEEPTFNIEELQRAIRYPEAARRRGIQGTVLVRVLVDRTGHAVKTLVDSDSDPLLTDAATAAVKAITYTPARQKGKPVSVWLMMPITFKLQ